MIVSVWSLQCQVQNLNSEVYILVKGRAHTNSLSQLAASKANIKLESSWVNRHCTSWILSLTGLNAQCRISEATARCKWNRQPWVCEQHNPGAFCRQNGEDCCCAAARQAPCPAADWWWWSIWGSSTERALSSTMTSPDKSRHCCQRYIDFERTSY